MSGFRSSIKAAIAACSLVLALGVAPAVAASFQEIVDGARKEGQLFVLISSPGAPATHAAVAKAFNERFGLNIRIEWTATNPVQTVTKLIAEQGGKTGFVDVIGAGGNQEMEALFTRKILKPYPWVEVFGGEFKSMSKAVDPVIDDLKGAGLLIAHNVYGIAWNKDMIADDKVPDSYSALLKPEWKGRFAVNAFSLNPNDYYSFAFSEDETLKMAKDILANAPVLERGTGAVTRAISVGQAPVGISSYHQAGRVANLKFKVFSDYIPIGGLHVFVPENAPNPNAARLFAAWFATEGMAVVNQHEPMPRLGEGTDLDKMVDAVLAKGGKILTEKSLADTQKAAAVRKKISDLMSR